MLAVVECAWTDGPPPWELVVAQMCREFHSLPSQIEEEELNTMLITWQVLNRYDEYRSKRK